MAHVNLVVTPSYPNVNVTSERKVEYVLVEVSPGSSGPTMPVQTSVVLVIDRSGSMNDQGRMTQARKAANLVVDQLHEDDDLAVIAFNEWAQPVISLDQNRKSKDKMKEILDQQLFAGGGTRLSAGMTEGYVQFARTHNGTVRKMIVLTDGETYNDEVECLELARRAGENGITISTVGLGESFNERLLMDISDAARGRAHHAARPDQLAGIFSQELAGAQAVAVVNPTLVIKLSSGVQIRRVHRVMPEVVEVKNPTIIDRVASIGLADLEQGKTQAILLELELPSRPAGQLRILQATVGDAVQDLILTYTDDATLASRVEPKVMPFVDRASLVTMQGKAEEAIATGDRGKATTLLRNLGTRLLEANQPELAQAAQDQAARLAAGEEADPAKAKQLSYGSRVLEVPADFTPPT